MPRKYKPLARTEDLEDKVKRVPAEVTAEQRQASAVGPQIKRGDIVEFTTDGYKTKGVVIRTPFDPGGMTDTYDVIPLGVWRSEHSRQDLKPLSSECIDDMQVNTDDD